MTQAEQERPRRRWGFFLIGSASFLVTTLLAVAVVFLWEEIQQTQVYGYAGGFVVSILGGITVIPVPSLLVTFTLGRVLHPVAVGLISGLGEALGGITIYLTGAGAGTMWTRLQTKSESQFWSKGQNYYDRLVAWVGGRGGSWVVFLASALIISPYYFAGLAAGSLRMGLLRFFLISWAGKTIRGLIIAGAGYWGLTFLLPWIGA